MKKLYWRPQRISLRVLILLSAVALGSFAAVERFRVHVRQPAYAEKIRAARLCRRAFAELKEERRERGLAIDVEVDPIRSGLIGELITPVTTNSGHLAAKQTSINPNWAAVAVELLRRANVGSGDLVAVGLSGSFPALNVSVLAALHVQKARVLLISSASASQWGANHPDFMWPDWERALRRRRVFSFRSLAVSPGGIDDRAVGLSQRGRELLAAAVKRNEMRYFEPSDYEDSLTRRMSLLREQAGDSEIRAYINVGGGTISVGTRAGKHMFRPGLNRYAPRGPLIDSVMARFISGGVPVIHISSISHLAKRFGLPLQPDRMPPVGQGQIFVREAYNAWLAASLLACLVALLFAFLRLDLGHRLFSTRQGDSGSSSPEQMV